MTWAGLGEWWRAELERDPGYEVDITPLVLAMLTPESGLTYLDVGCGDGRVMRSLTERGVSVVGLDSDRGLLADASRFGPVVCHRLPNLGCFGEAVFDGCLVSLVLEHLDDHVTFLAELARVTKEGGVLALVANHPSYTAPGSAPIAEEDGEVTWRHGEYFSAGHTDEPAGEGTIRFHHRPLGDLLTAASIVGWDLRRLVELPATEGMIERHPPLGEQRHIPRLMAARWVRRAGD